MSIAQTKSKDSVKTLTSLTKLKQITLKTYEIHIDEIRTANLIFAEHKNYKRFFKEKSKEIEDLRTTIELLKKDKIDLLSKKSSLESILLVKDNQIENNNTYHKSQIKSYKRQRNRAWIVSGAAIVLSVLVITSN